MKCTRFKHLFLVKNGVVKKRKACLCGEFGAPETVTGLENVRYAEWTAKELKVR